jgi:hypothetical protein
VKLNPLKGKLSTTGNQFTFKKSAPSILLLFRPLNPMSDFYREAIAVAMNSLEDPLVPKRHPATLEEAALILSKLNPEQRCDAIYADWLLQLHNPGGSAQIQIRDLLLGQGAMDAHYLAELTQNADDAGATNLLLAMEDDWLLVANNGKPINALNLLGLCRFFVHSNGRVVGLTPETIGRFGIGFKASHRVAEQVIVSTWSEKSGDSFGFRLPIAISKTSRSHPDQEVLNRVLTRLRSYASFEGEIRPLDQLGHCTPEFLGSPASAIPAALKVRCERFCKESKSGTWFAMKLHRAGFEDAKTRMGMAKERILEVSPMFLKNVKRVEFQDRVITLKKSSIGGLQAGNLRAGKLTFGFESRDEGARSERFLILEPGEADGVWKIAIPVNSNGMLYVPPANQPLSWKGSLHAYLPLSGLVWPHRCHIHLGLPPNLARSAWNADQDGEVARALEDIATRLAEWLLENTGTWHPEWQPSLMLGVVSAQGPPTEAAGIFLTAFRQQLLSNDLVRSIWGNMVSAEKALELALEDGTQPRDAWTRVARRLSAHEMELLPIVPTIGSVDVLELPRMTTEQAAELLLKISKVIDAPDHEFWIDYIWCAIGCILQPTNSMTRGRYLEKVIEAVPVVRESGEVTGLKALAITDGKCRLELRWHEVFSAISSWLPPQSSLADTTFHGCPLKSMLRGLSQPSETPTTWDEVEAAINAGAVGLLQGIWKQNMPPCPPGKRKVVVGGLVVGQGITNTSLANTWVLGAISSPLNKALTQPPDKDRLRQQIEAWNLREAYVEIVTRELPANLKSAVAKDLEGPLTATVTEKIFKPLGALPVELRDCASGVLKKIFEERLKSEIQNLNKKIVIVGDLPGKTALSRLPSIVCAPEWLTSGIVHGFCLPLQIDRDLGIEFVVAGDLTVARRDELGQILLDGFPDWDEVLLDDEACEALTTYFANATGNWPVRLRGNVTRRLNEFVSLPDSAGTGDYDDSVSLTLAAQDPLFNEIRKLPPNLARIAPLRNAALSISRFSTTALESADCEELSDVPESLAANPWFAKLRERLPRADIVSHPEIATMVYSYGDARVTIKNPAFAVCRVEDRESIVVFGSGDRRPEEDGNKYAGILNHYHFLSPEDKLVRRCLQNGKNFASFYRKHREKIVNRLREVHATDLGYEARHVLRELLQNTETSYATSSRKYETGSRTFSVRLDSAESGSEFLVSVTHCGRAFNEPLPGGQPIDDIIRICSLESEVQNVPGWRGRFNKGFKSLFQVTDGVKVTSGAYSFELTDLILLDPIEPLPDPEMSERPTTFEFRIPLRIRREFLAEGSGRGAKTRAFKTEALVFLEQIDRVEIIEGKRILQEFKFERGSVEAFPGWTQIEITDQEGICSRFLVKSGQHDGKRYGVGVSLADGMKPNPIAGPSRKLFRTFPLEQPADFASFLIEADFTTDQGRLGLREFDANGALVVQTIRSAVSLLRLAIDRFGRNRQAWLDWVTWFDLRSVAKAGDNFPSISGDLKRELKLLKEWLLERIPIGGELRPLGEVVVPSPLLIRLIADPRFFQLLRPQADTWVSGDVAEVLRQEFEWDIRPLRLDSHVVDLMAEGSDRSELRAGLELAKVEKLTTIPFEEWELIGAQQVVDPPISIPITLPPPSSTWVPDVNIDDIVDAWDEEAAVEEFTVGGPLGSLILPGCGGDLEIAELLSQPSTLAGKEVWFRLLCLGCSFSTLLGTAPRKRVTELWRERLRDEFWMATVPSSLEEAGDADFNQGLDRFFEDVIHRTFRDPNAGGEDAEFWRRVFYDFRKMHYFVYRNHLPETIIGYTEFEAADGPGLIKFLRTGQIQDEFRDPNEPRFTGVIGQSMSSPLLFIMRELARLEVIDGRFHATCYYMNRPARKIASRLGWIPDDGLSRYSFTDLVDYSQAVHQKLEEVPKFNGFFDLPLQWHAVQPPK